MTSFSDAATTSSSTAATRVSSPRESGVIRSQRESCQRGGDASNSV
jgi:hypothetical protein